MPKAIEVPKLWAEDDLGAKRHARIRLPPTIPDLGWRRPENPPNLSSAVVVAFDTETKDPNLDDEGPGWARNDGHIVGVSLAAQDRLGNRGKWYFPLRHEIGGELNIDPAPFFDWLRPVMASPIPKVGANVTYDIGWLGEENVQVNGELHEIQFAEALIDSNALVGLEHLSNKYIGRGKTTAAMYDWQRQAYPNTPETKRRKDIYRTPPQLVGYYAEDDAANPLDISLAQLPQLRAESLDYVYRLECDLIPLMIRMRRAGVRVDVERARSLLVELQGQTAELYAQVYRDYGRNIGSTDSREIAPLLESVGIVVPRTEATEKAPDGNPSVQKEWLAGLEHPLGQLLNNIREHEKISGTFLQSYILNKNRGGFLFPQFHQMKNDDNGTMVGRFASSVPNLQNIPARTKLGKLVRECFVPDIGDICWQKNDFSQIHYRILAHYAVDEGDGSADELRRSYIENPDMDYHKKVYENVCPFLGWDATDAELADFRRRPIKNVNFGLLYGQAIKSLMYKTATYFGASFTEADAQAFIDAYFAGAPYVKPTMKAIGQEVQRDGFVTTLLGRRIRFDQWEPIRRGEQEGYTLPYDDALRRWGPSIRRAFEYRGVNYKFQGSEPDIMKSGLRDCLRSGVFDYTGVPRVTVHDELGFSVKDDTPAMREAFDFIRVTMENTVPMRIPVKMDETRGVNWGKAK